jgi:hypothetical protein
MTAPLLDPVLEEHARVLPRRPLDRLPQVVRIDVGILVLLQVPGERAVESLVSEDVPEHVEDERSLDVGQLLLIVLPRLLPVEYSMGRTSPVRRV